MSCADALFLVGRSVLRFTWLLLFMLSPPSSFYFFTSILLAMLLRFTTRKLMILQIGCLSDRYVVRIVDGAEGPYLLLCTLPS